MLEVCRCICVWGADGECVWCWWGMRVLLHGEVLQGVRGLLMWGASTIDGACVCNCPISYTRMPHQQQMRPTSIAHTHPTAPHHAAKHACLISTTRTPHQHPTHTYIYTLLTIWQFHHYIGIWVVPTSHVTIFLSHSIVSFFFFLTFDGSIITLNSTNITYDSTFATFGCTHIFF